MTNFCLTVSVVFFFLGDFREGNFIPPLVICLSSAFPGNFYRHFFFSRSWRRFHCLYTYNGREQANRQSAGINVLTTLKSNHLLQFFLAWWWYPARWICVFETLALPPAVNPQSRVNPRPGAISLSLPSRGSHLPLQGSYYRLAASDFFLLFTFYFALTYSLDLINYLVDWVPPSSVCGIWKKICCVSIRRRLH